MDLFSMVPDDIILEIITNLDFEDVLNCYGISKRFNAILRKHSTLLNPPRHYFFWKMIKRMEHQEQNGFKSSITKFKNAHYSISSPHTDPEPPEQVVAHRKNSIAHKLLHFWKKKPKKEELKKESTKHHLKLLVLGPGFCGKSTLFKQLTVLHGEHKISDKLSTVIYSQIASIVNYNLPRDLQLQVMLQTWADNSNMQHLNEILDKIMTMGDLEDLVKNSMPWTEYCNSLYFLKHKDRVLNVDTCYTVLDWLLARQSTIGIHESVFDCSGRSFRLLDVGGARSERRRWINCFQDVDLVLFCASLSEYNLVLYEDERCRRIDESFLLLQEFLSSKWFVETKIILVLTHLDVFKDKIRTEPLSNSFEEFKGSSYDEAVKFITGKYEEVFVRAGRPFRYVTVCTVDTESVCDAWIQILQILEDLNADKEHSAE